MEINELADELRIIHADEKGLRLENNRPNKTNIHIKTT